MMMFLKLGALKNSLRVVKMMLENVHQITTDVYKSYARNKLIKKHCVHQKHYQIE